MHINFSDIPGHQNLFLDYINEFENVKTFYRRDFRSREEYSGLFESVSQYPREFRAELTGIISGQYSDLNPSEKTERNIKLLNDSKTLAVVTGQQLGIAGGPMYTLYKIISAVKLSRHLTERYDEYNFVPLFWMEGDDHDFDEIKSISVINDQNKISKISYEDENLNAENRGSVGGIELKVEINNFFSRLDANLRNSEFKAELLEKLVSFYMPGNSLKHAFRQLLFWLFDQYGLVIFDPQDRSVKKLLKWIFKKEIQDFRSHTEKLVHTSAELEELYHAQVKIRPINLFYGNEEGRYLIEPVENEFKLKRKKKKFTLDEILEEIENYTDRFSPNVLLRPICQDHLFPTVFYIAGPSEIAYFAQIMPLYDIFKIEPPIIYPRSSITLLEKNVLDLCEKYNLKVPDIFIESNSLKEKVVKSLSDISIDDIFQAAKNEIDITFDKLKERLFEIDATISTASERYRQKVLQQIVELESKSVDAQNRKFETTLRQIDKISANLFPNYNLQERELNFTYFYNKYGMDFVKYLFDELAINKFEHQILKLEMG